jgi:hypothetical protein
MSTFIHEQGFEYVLGGREGKERRPENILLSGGIPSCILGSDEWGMCHAWKQ